METTIMGYIGLYWDNGKSNGNCISSSTATKSPFQASDLAALPGAQPI